MKLSKSEQTKQQIIKVAAELFLKQGYSNTGINDILSYANVSKGSFYFYFSSKKDIALEVANYYGKSLLIDWLNPISTKPWDVFVKQVVDDIKATLSKDNYFGCPIAVLGLDISFVDDNLTKAYAEGIKKLISVFSNSLQVSGLTKNKADIMARKAFALYQGHILYYKITKDEKAIDHILNDLLVLI